MVSRHAPMVDSIQQMKMLMDESRKDQLDWDDIVKLPGPGFDAGE